MDSTVNYSSKLHFIGVGVSGGPDSMALLDMLKVHHLKKYNIVAIHVNYGLRETAYRDQKIVQEYCQKHNIVCVIYQAPNLNQGNFQHNARDYRFKVYKEVIKAYDALSLYLGHHQDDQLETILFQLLSQREPDYLGMKKESMINGIQVNRPLLDWTKDEILEYCFKNGIDYGLDESNEEPVYTRNRIRIALKSLDESQKQKLLDYQKVYARSQQILKEKTKKFLENIHEIEISQYIECEERVRLSILRNFFKLNGLNTSKLTKRHLLELDKVISTNKQAIVPVSNQHSLLIEYGMIRLMTQDFEPYSFELKRYHRVDEKYFKFNEHTGTGVTLKKSDYPIIIRNARNDDEIKMRYGTKKLNRYFIDNKISHKDRRSWPVIENAAGEVICVAELGCDVNHHELPYNAKIKRKKIDG